MGYEIKLWFAVAAVGALVLVATTRRGRGWAADLAEAVRDAMDNFRGGPPRPMHPSPIGDAPLLTRRAKRRRDLPRLP